MIASITNESPGAAAGPFSPVVSQRGQRWDHVRPRRDRLRICGISRIAPLRPAASCRRPPQRRAHRRADLALRDAAPSLPLWGAHPVK
jgi:hypothetical protein